MSFKVSYRSKNMIIIIIIIIILIIIITKTIYIAAKNRMNGTLSA